MKNMPLQLPKGLQIATPKLKRPLTIHIKKKIVVKINQNDPTNQKP
jgi:hypothetical protein